jgi:hypothetical protein
VSLFAVVGLLIALAALLFVLYPLVTTSPRAATVASIDEAAERRRDLYRQILELEFDQKLGKLDESDAREQSEQLLRQAAALLPADGTVPPDASAEIEREIAALRQALAGAARAGLSAASVKVLPALLVAGLALWPASAVAAESGVIEGRVTNATQNGAPAAGATVVLHVVAGERVERRETIAGEQGEYRFDGLSTEPGPKYLPVTEFQGALYFGQPLSLAEQSSQTADISVYESTRSDQWIALQRTNLLIQNVGPSRLDVMEMGAVANVGERTYIGPEAAAEAVVPTLQFSLPAGATGLAPQLGFAPNTLIPGTDGFGIQSPIVPGRHQLAYSYVLPFGSDRLEIRKRVDYPALSFNLYVPDLGLGVHSPQLKPQGAADFGGQKFQLYSAENLPRGTELQIVLTGLPSTGGLRLESFSWPILLAGGSTLAAGIILAYRRRTSKLGELLLPASPALEPTAALSSLDQPAPDALELERLQLLLRLARLDEKYESGDLPRERYERERESGKRQLLDLRERQVGAVPGVE